MINPIELIQEYKDQGYDSKTAASMAKTELKDRKALALKGNLEQLSKDLHNANRKLSEDTNRWTLKKTNFAI